MKYQYFVASRWRNKDQVTELVDMIRAKDKSVYSFFESDNAEFELKDPDQQHTPDEFMQMFESIPNWQSDPEVRRIFDVDMNALKDSECLILLLPAGKSAHIEAGAAYGMNKRLVVIGEQKETESLYLIFDEFYDTINDFVASL